MSGSGRAGKRDWQGLDKTEQMPYICGMTDLDRLLLEAWGRVLPGLKGDAEEVRKRLARRRTREARRWPRAWCIAARASDNRITPYTAAMGPEHALDTEDWRHPGRVIPHTVVLERRLLEVICAPVEIGPPGEPADEVAKKLGCSVCDLVTLRRKGFFRVHYKKGLRGRRGKPVPLLFTWEMLDPSAVGLKPTDPIWAHVWRYHPQSLPEGFAQELDRVPRFQPVKGGERLVGWRWICPGCKDEVRTVYCPMPMPQWSDWVGWDPAPSGAEAMPQALSTFACMRCHDVCFFSRGDVLESWNSLVMHLTGGMMYGREVERPDWLTEEPKRVYRKHAQKPLEPEIQRTLDLLVDTELPLVAIARELGVAPEAVACRAIRLRRRFGAKDREELRQICRPAVVEAVVRAAG